METVADLVGDARERDAALFAAADGPVEHSYEAFLTTAWKAGNLLRHYGVRPGDSVAVAVGPREPTADDEMGRLGGSPTPLLAVLGGTLAGASVNLDPVTTVEAKALVAPTAWLDEFTPGPGTKPIGYGGEVTEPTVAQFERETWSENPVAPPVDLAPTTAALGGSRPLAHGDLLAETRRVVADYGLEVGDRVGLDAPLTPGALVAGILAPLSVGATVVLADGGGELDAVVSESQPSTEGPAWIDPRSVLAGRTN